MFTCFTYLFMTCSFHMFCMSINTLCGCSHLGFAHWKSRLLKKIIALLFSRRFPKQTSWVSDRKPRTIQLRLKVEHSNDPNTFSGSKHVEKTKLELYKPYYHPQSLQLTTSVDVTVTNYKGHYMTPTRTQTMHC